MLCRVFSSWRAITCLPMKQIFTFFNFFVIIWIYLIKLCEVFRSSNDMSVFSCSFFKCPSSWVILLIWFPFFLFYCCFIISFILIVCFVHTLESACSFWAMNVVHRLWISIHSQINDVTKRSTNEKHWQRARTLMRTKHVYDLSSIYLFFTSHSFIFHNFFFSHTFLISRTETKQNKVIVKNKKK